MSKNLAMLTLVVFLGCGENTETTSLLPDSAPDSDGTTVLEDVAMDTTPRDEPILPEDTVEDSSEDIGAPSDTNVDAGAEEDAISDATIESDASPPSGGLCAGFCGTSPPGGGCYCDEVCISFGDCCEGYCDDCPGDELCLIFPPDHGENGVTIVSHNLPESIECGASFEGEVVVLNTGTSTWTAEKKLRLGTQLSVNYFGDFLRVELPDGEEVEPGEEWTFQVPMLGPPEEYMENAYNVSFDVRWGMVHEGVQWFGEEITQTVAVTCDAVDPIPANEGLSDPVEGPEPGNGGVQPSSALLFVESPIPTSVGCGETFTISMRIINTGESTWTQEDLFGFGSWGNRNYLGNSLRVTIPEGEEIPPGEEWLFTMEATAPPASFINNIAGVNGVQFPLEWSMIQENVTWFSNHLFRNIAVSCPDEE